MNVGTPGTLLKGMLNDGLLTIEPPIEGRVLERNPIVGVLPGGNPSVGILAVGICPLGGLKAKARDADTHRRTKKSRSASQVTILLRLGNLVALNCHNFTGLLTIAIMAKNPQA